MLKDEHSAALPLMDEVEDELRFGRFRALPRRQQLFLGDEQIGLSSRAFDILMVLIQAHGALMTKNEIMSRVWPETVVEENNLTVHIAALRKVLGRTKSSSRRSLGAATVSSAISLALPPIRCQRQRK